MDSQNEKYRRKQEFLAGFFAGLTVVGGVALILLAWFLF